MESRGGLPPPLDDMQLYNLIAILQKNKHFVVTPFPSGELPRKKNPGSTPEYGIPETKLKRGELPF